MRRPLSHILAQLDVPVGEVNEVFPTVVLVEREIDLQEGTPLRPLGLANETHSSFLRRPVRLERVALDAGADDVLPRRRATPITRD